MKIESRPKKVKEYTLKIKLSEEEAKLLSNIGLTVNRKPIDARVHLASPVINSYSINADIKFVSMKQALLLGEIIKRTGEMIHED